MAQVTYRGVQYDTKQRNNVEQKREKVLTYRGIKFQKSAS